MADNDVQQFKIDASQGLAALQQIIAGFDGSNAAAIRLTRTITDFNAANKSGQVVLSGYLGTLKQFKASIQATNKDGQFVFDKDTLRLQIRDSFQAAGKEAEKQSRELTAKLLQVSNIAGKAKIESPLAKDFFSSASATQIKDIESSFGTLNLSVKRAAVTSKELKGIFDGLSSGKNTIADFVGPAKNVAIAFEKLKATATGLPDVQVFLKGISQSLVQAKAGTVLGASISGTNVIKDIVSSSARNNATLGEIGGAKQASGALAREVDALKNARIDQTIDRIIAQAIDKVQKAGGDITKVTIDMDRVTAQATASVNKSLEKIFRDLGAGKFGALPDDAEKLAKAYLDVKVALDQVGASAGRSRAAQQQLVNAKKVREDLKSSFDISSLSGLSDADTNKLERGIDRVVKTFASAPGKINKNDFNNLFRSIAAGTETPFDGIKGRLATALRDVQTTFRALEAESRAHIAKEATNTKRNAEALNVADSFKTSLPIPGKTALFSGIDPASGAALNVAKSIEPGLASIDRFQKAIDAIKLKIKKGIFDPTDLTEAQNRLKTGITAPFEEEPIEKARQAFIAIEKAYQGMVASVEIGSRRFIAAQEANIKSLQKQVTEQRRVADEILRGQNTANRAASLPDAFNTISGAATKAFGQVPSGANFNDVSSIQGNITRIAEQLNAVKINYKQFLVELDNVKNKRLLPPSSDPEINALRRNITSLGSSFETAGARSEDMGRKLITLSGAFRLLVTQELHAIIARITNGFVEATKAASQFGIQISLIQTITQDANVRSDQWNSTLRQVSDNLGRPINEVAGAAYEALSNQITQANDDTRAFLQTSLEFGRTVNASAVDSVNLLSSAINGYKLSITDTDRIASGFFNSIDFGRVKASDLANTFGRIAPLATHLGVSFEETNAALDALTLQGQQANEAYTLLNNVFVKFAKPTEAGGGFLKKLGFESGQEIIAVKGLGGALTEVEAAVARGDVQFSEFATELRALRGILGLTGESGKTYNHILDEMTKGTDKFKQAIKITEEPFGKRFENEINRIKNVFIDLAQGFAEDFVRFSEAVGGLSNRFTELGTIAYQVAQIIGSIIVSFYTLREAIFIINEIKVGLLGLSAVAVLNPVTIGIITFVAAFTAANVILDRFEAAAKKALKAKNDLNQTAATKNIGAFDTGLSNQKGNFEAAVKAQEQTYGNAVSRMRIILDQVFDHHSEKVKELARTTEDSFKGITGILEQGIKNIESAFKRADEVVKRINDTVKSNDSNAAKAVFDRQREALRTVTNGKISNPEISLVEKRIAALEQQRQSVTKNLASGNINDDSLQKANSLYEEQTQLLEGLTSELNNARIEAARFHQTPVNVGVVASLGQVAQLESRIATLRKQHNSDLLSQQKIIADIAIERKKQVEQEEAALKEIQALFKKIQDTSIVDSKGELPASDTLKSSRDKAIEKINHLKEDQNKLTELIQKQGERLFQNPTAQLTQQIGLFQAFTEQKKALQDQLSSLTESKIDQGETALAVQNLNNNYRGFNATLKETKLRFGEISDALSKVNSESQNNIVGVKGLIESLKQVKLPENFKTGFLTAGSTTKNNEAFKTEFDNLNNLNVSTPQGVEAAIQSVEKLKSVVQDAEQNTGQGMLKELIYGPDGQTNIQIGAALDSLRFKLSSLGSSFGESNTLTQQMNQLGLSIKGMQANLDGLPEALLGSKEQFRTFAETIINDSPGAINATKQLADALREAAGAANSLNAAQSVGRNLNVQGKRDGGFITPFYFASGGTVPNSQHTIFSPRNGDTVPAMLRPYEYVSTQEAAGRFAHELRLMDRGIDPWEERLNNFKTKLQFFSDGGMVFAPNINGLAERANTSSGQSAASAPTTNVGDIHMNFYGNVNGRNVAQELHREIRRGNLNLNRR